MGVAMKIMRATLVLAAVGAMAATASAEPPKKYGDALSGKGYAILKCAECHAVTKETKVSPNIKAPPFMVIANSKMVTVREVDQWMATAHQDMPDMGLDTHIRGDIIAYLQSLSPMDPMQ